jgi:hypothetical protein
VDRRRLDAVAVQLLCQPVRAVLGAREHECLLDAPRLDEVAQQLALPLTVDGVDQLRDQRRGPCCAARPGRTPGRAGCHRRAAGSRPRTWPRTAGSGAAREQREDLADVADEPHVQHAVRLIEHQDLDVRQVDRALADVVEQTAGRGDDDLRTGAQRADLRIEPDAAIHDRGTDGTLGAVRADALLDLEREFAGRRQDERADRAAAGRTCARRRRSGIDAAEQLEERQDEGGRLAGAVWAAASTSRPASTNGMASRCTGVGSV